ncbi:TPA: transposase [Raoultella ornithinolytica]|nr:transposase [Raoultella ornithinolytica]
MITVLTFVEAKQTIKDIYHEDGISEASYYNWKAKYGEMAAFDIKRRRIPRTKIAAPIKCLLI